MYAHIPGRSVLFSRLLFSRPLAVAVFLSLAVAGTLSASGQDLDPFHRHLTSGEFSVARTLVLAAADPATRDQMLAELAVAQRAAGVADDSFQNAIEISNDDWRMGTLARISSFGDMPPVGGDGGAGDIPGSGPGGVGGFRGGGITEADFDDLINLIQETIDPDSWEINGGTARMRPFPSGVLVDPDGVMKQVKTAPGGRLDELRQSADVVDDLTLEKETALRAISLTRLERALQLRAARGQPANPEMLCLGGIYRLQYLMLYPESGDIVIAGPAGSWHYDAQGRAINDQTGQPVLNLDDLVICLRNAASHQGRFGCSIDPRADNLAAARQFIETSTLQGQAWRDRLRDILGQQDVFVDGIDAATHAGRVIVEADYHMKLIGMGLEPSVSGVPDYFQRLHLDEQGNPPRIDSLVRWWFTMSYDAVQTNVDRTIFEISGQGVRLQSESEFMDDQGQRVHTGQSSPAAGGFARDFTTHFDDLVQQYPLYGELRNLFDCALAANLIYREGLNRQIDWRLNYFQGDSGNAAFVYQPAIHRTPLVVDSIMGQRVMTHRQGRQTRTHTVSGVSGGVEYDPDRLVRSDSIIRQDGPRLTGKLERVQPESGVSVTRWNWDEPEQP